MNCHVTYIDKTTQSLNYIWDTYFHSLSETCRQYILQFKRNEDRLDRLIGRVLILKALTDKGFSKNCLQHILLDKNSRPYINKNIDFNISHSGDIVICAIAENCRIGIDIEKITSVNPADYNKFFNSQQLHAITTAKNQNLTFFNSWTTRESLLKADGRGLTLPLQDFDSQLNRCTIDNSHFYYQQLNIAPGYSCHISSSPKIDTFITTPVSINQGI